MVVTSLKCGDHEVLLRLPIVSAYTFLNTIGKLTPSLPLLVNPHCSHNRQWGSANGTDGSNPPWYNFPISFPDICYQVVTNRKDNGWGAVDGNSAGACDWNKTQVRIYSNDGTVPVNYIAIGK